MFYFIRKKKNSQISHHIFSVRNIKKKITILFLAYHSLILNLMSFLALIYHKFGVINCQSLAKIYICFSFTLELSIEWNIFTSSSLELMIISPQHSQNLLVFVIALSCWGFILLLFLIFFIIAFKIFTLCSLNSLRSI